MRFRRLLGDGLQNLACEFPNRREPSDWCNAPATWLDNSANADAMCLCGSHKEEIERRAAIAPGSIIPTQAEISEAWHRRYIATTAIGLNDVDDASAQAEITFPMALRDIAMGCPEVKNQRLGDVFKAYLTIPMTSLSRTRGDWKKTLTAKVIQLARRAGLIEELEMVPSTVNSSYHVLHRTIVAVGGGRSASGVEERAEMARERIRARIRAEAATRGRRLY